jgi:hypothetical protein
MTTYRCVYRGKDGHLHRHDMQARNAESVRRQVLVRPDVYTIIAVYPVNPYTTPVESE